MDCTATTVVMGGAAACRTFCATTSGNWIRMKTRVGDKDATIKIGQYRAVLAPSDFAWTGRKKPSELLKVGDLAQFSIKEIGESTVRVQLEQQPAPQAAMLAI